MKNTLFCIVLLCATATTAQKARFGIFGGITYYDAPAYQAETPTDEVSTVGHNPGAFVDFNFYDRYGAKFHFSLNTKKIAFEEQLDLTYLDFGLFLKADLDGNYGRGFYLFGGPRVSLLTSAKDGDLDLEEGINNTQFGLVAGVGVHLNKFLELELLLDADLGAVLSLPQQQVKIIGAGLNLKLELNAMLNWHIPSAEPLKL